MKINENELKKKLADEQYKVLRERKTEIPYIGKYVHKTADGVYTCVVCGNKLFSSIAQFDSGTGWPSFDEALPGAVKYVNDDSIGIRRVEVVCAKCDSHLGHLFNDGPTKTGKRYCINSVCFDLIS